MRAAGAAAPALARIRSLEVADPLDHQIGKAVRAQLFAQHKADIGHGLVTDAGPVGDFAIGQPFGDQAQDFLFPRGQAGAGAALAGDVHQRDLGGKAAFDIMAAAQNLVQRGHDFRGRGVLVQHAIGPGMQRAARQHRAAMHAEHKDRQRRVQQPQAVDQLDPGGLVVGQLQVDHHQVGPPGAPDLPALQRRDDRDHLAIHPRLDDRAPALDHHGMVVHDDDPARLGIWTAAAVHHWVVILNSVIVRPSR